MLVYSKCTIKAVVCHSLITIVMLRTDAFKIQPLLLLLLQLPYRTHTHTRAQTQPHTI